MIKLERDNKKQEVVPMETTPEAEDAKEADDDLFASIDAAANAAEAQGVQQVVSVEEACKAEMQRYLLLPRLQVVKDKVHGKHVFNDPLSWWKQHKAQLPVLAQLAQIYLAVQASSAPSERVFSTASLLISNRRSAMDSTIAGKMMFVSDNWHHWKDMDLLKALYQ